MALSEKLFELRLVDHFPAATETGAMLPVYRLTTADAPAAIEGAGYFNAAVKHMPKGTIIHALNTINGTPTYKVYLVTANNGTAVTVAKQTFA